MTIRRAGQGAENLVCRMQLFTSVNKGSRSHNSKKDDACERQCVRGDCMPETRWLPFNQLAPAERWGGGGLVSHANCLAIFRFVVTPYVLALRVGSAVRVGVDGSHQVTSHEEEEQSCFASLLLAHTNTCHPPCFRHTPTHVTLFPVHTYTRQIGQARNEPVLCSPNPRLKLRP